ncbi:hypothetical protein BDV93DRAFT_611672 [Ceratobasidium sp. AG-I]|nr:hypothetical protein BDV93DRAFT_611672 [Ceratobasidium sp. AG-I]
MPNPRVFFNFQADDQPLGRVVFELFRDEVPKTVENFRALATGEKGLSQVSQVPLYYKGCIVHRSIENFMIQGGDFTKRNGTGGESIYGHPFEDENFDRDVDAEGLLVMANRGPNTNSSQFFITVRPCPHLNGKHVVFGKAPASFTIFTSFFRRVVSGLEVIQQISEMPVDEKARPLKPVVIVSCGELELKKAAPKPREPTPESRSASPSSDEREKRKSKRRSRSKSQDKEKSKSKKRKSKRKDDSDSEREQAKGKEKDGEPHKETEEEYDARLEREEKERNEARRRAELEEKRRVLEREREKAAQTGGVRYKGEFTLPLLGGGSACLQGLLQYSLFSHR